MKLYLVRHAESLKNKDGQDRTALTPLSENGLKQAKIVARRLKPMDIDLIYSSTLVRAKQTAEVISQNVNRPVEYWDKLIEGNQTTESFADLNLRAAAVLDHLLTEHKGQRVVCVSHATMIETLVAKMIFEQDLTPEIMHRIRKHTGTANTGITICEFSDSLGWILQTYNDSSHL